MNSVGHVMILASAGSGKTYQLTNRFVKLLARGAPPERIVALTFTRKAAGEFFDEILNKLAGASQEVSLAARLAQQIGEPALTSVDFLRMLRGMIDAMHRLCLGTLDSFFARIVRGFPLELGLGGDFEILQDHAARLERRRVLQRLFQGVGRLTKAQREFIEAFKRATFGTEEKRLGSRLDALLDEYQDVYLAAPDADCWGDPHRIWPDGCPWLPLPADLAPAKDRLQTWIEKAAIAERQRQRWLDFAAALDAWHPGASPPQALTYVLGKMIPQLGELKAGRGRLEFDHKEQPLTAVACVALATIARGMIGRELARRLETTRGVHAVLRSYEAVYHESVRRAGKLTFADVQRLLAPGAARLLSQEHAEGRLFLDFRLDARFDHWLLDEFQDTSFGQWSVLRNLIDETIQDPSGARSFFYVGDVKQAIFAWREGDPRLFREIFEHYNRSAPGTIGEQRLDRSFRSGPAIVGMLNRVFGATEILRDLFPRAAVDDWERAWRDHESASPELGGQAALLHADDEAGRFASTLEILREIKPFARGLTCAVLVQRNETAARLADFLRRTGGLPALAESDLCVCVDNPLGAALLALCKAAAHPGDTLAWEHLRMTPLGTVLEKEDLARPDALSLRVLTELNEEGFERTMEAWLRRLEPQLETGDAFSRERGAQFAAAARIFDEAGRRDIMEFIRFMESYTERETESETVVRVMTVHKAKGLGFDVVILPDLEGQRLDQRRGGLAVQKAADRSVNWVFDLPSKQFYEADQILSDHVLGAEVEACYEKLSLLYVAMTRAQRAMYVIVEPPGKSISRNYPQLLARTLAEVATAEVRVGDRAFPGAYSGGAPAWFAAITGERSEGKADGDLLPLVTGGMMCDVRLPVRRPSDPRTGIPATIALLPDTRVGAAEVGIAVHGLFATVEWWSGEGRERWIEARRAEGFAESALAEVLGCLDEPALTPVFARPAGLAEVWRERAFEAVLDNIWVTGVFDRVIVERDPAGHATRAAVIDFKTDRAADSAKALGRHADQLDYYRRVVAGLTGLPVGEVTGDLLFTAERKLVRVPPPAEILLYRGKNAPHGAATTNP
jgi:ATP-dependent helicase/nuclease subunit A